MDVIGEREIDNRGRKDIYEYVERSGSVPAREVRAATGMNQREFGHHLTILERDGVIEEHDGELRVAYDAGETERYEAGDATVEIRPARQGDVSGLVGVMRATVDEQQYAVAETLVELVDREGVLLRANGAEARVFFVACVDDDVVGWVHLATPQTERLAHTAQVTVGVLSTYQNRGIGSRLLDRATAWADDRGLEKLYNSVPATNDAAVDFLAARGWEVSARRERHFRIDGDDVDELLMERWL